jgi:hypothetical protein
MSGGDLDKAIGSQAEEAELGRNNIHAIYSNGNETALNRADKLLINALCQDDDDSRSALRQFFDLPTPRRSAEPEVDRVLISSPVVHQRCECQSSADLVARPQGQPSL